MVVGDRLLGVYVWMSKTGHRPKKMFPPKMVVLWGENVYLVKTECAMIVSK